MIYNVKPDVILRMDASTFNDLADKKISGARAVFTGRLSISGSIFALKNFESNVVNKYFPEV